MSMRRALVAAVAGFAALAIGCGGDDDGGAAGEGGDGESLRGQSIEVWTNEFQPDRMAATEDILADFTQKTGIKTKLVPIAEDQAATLITNAAAADELPDVVLGNSNADSLAYTAQGVYDAEAAQAVIDRLGKETFSGKALELVSSDGIATGVPSDAWGTLLIYRRDVFEEAGLDAPETVEDIRAAAEQLHSEDMVGITLGTAEGDDFTSQAVEHLALPFGCQLVDDSGTVTIDSPECVQALEYYGDLARNYSVNDAQDVESTRATYFAGRAAMILWSPFILDGMAGLRDDTKPSCDQCKKNPAFLAENSGLIGPIGGPGGEPTQVGVVSTFNIAAGANTEAAQALVEFMMTDGYVRWLALSPQGKYPVRSGPEPGSTEYEDAWEELESGVDRKAPLSKSYSQEAINAIGESTETITRWAFPQGQGALLGAMSASHPMAKAGVDVIAGKDPAQAAEDAQAEIEEIQASLE